MSKLKIIELMLYLLVTWSLSLAVDTWHFLCVSWKVTNYCFLLRQIESRMFAGKYLSKTSLGIGAFSLSKVDIKSVFW